MRDADPHDAVQRARVKRRWQVAGYVVGLVLFGAAIFAVVRQHDVLLGAVQSVRGASPWLIAFAIVLPALNWLVVSISLWVLTNAYGRVGFGEMLALIANAWMLNYLPMRPGMAGRVTYHKLINQIRVRDSAKVIMQATIMTGISLVMLGALALSLTDRAADWAWLIALAAPGAALGAAALLLATRPFARRMTIALLMRHVDMLIWAGRYWVVFKLLDVDLGVAGVIALAVISQIALLVPFTGNGLGIREWLIGWFAARVGTLLPAGVILGVEHQAVGLAADLVNRAAELSVSIPVGLVAAWWLARRVARAGFSRMATSEIPPGIEETVAGLTERSDPADDDTRITS